MEQDEEGNFFVEGIKVILKDVMGTNGVIHIIDDVIVPETARSVSQALEQKGRATLKELFDLAEINEDNGLSNVTIFGPSEEVIYIIEMVINGFYDKLHLCHVHHTDVVLKFQALEELDEDLLKSLKENPAELREFLMMHITTPKR